ncbi:LOW QUALITY PROTEIN: uncharacterized protein EMH_0012500 [Eimeria mitis]|uniref:Uncharacterized protein n=1 Tax=Eimeria mitis TaxID=44415 RepID=U6K8C5_9EIME|nr:LOW QUALITY PROTEIN: uncharacterized protein EMH_0012500 [Eimeria mitis]CDJ32437.1 hypothetical protein EMH_0012500 [Eimeria mitis]
MVTDPSSSGGLAADGVPHPHPQAGVQIPVHPEDWQQTAFHIPTRKLECTWVEPDPAKIEAIQRWLLPLYKGADVQKLVGIVSYYRNIISGFVRIAVYVKPADDSADH